MEQEQENENNSGIFGKPMKYKEICRIFDDEEFTRGNQRENQLKRWNKNFEIIKEKTYYTILRERTSEEKQITYNKGKYQKHIEDFLVLYLSNEKLKGNTECILTTRNILEMSCMVNLKYYKAMNKKEILFDDYDIQDSIEVKEQDLPRYLTKQEYEIKKITNESWIFFSATKRLLKRLVEDSLRTFEKSSLILKNKTFVCYKNYKIGNKWHSKMYKCDNKMVERILSMQNKAMKEFNGLMEEKYKNKNHNIKDFYQNIYLPREDKEEFDKILDYYFCDEFQEEGFTAYGSAFELKLADALCFKNELESRNFDWKKLNDNVIDKLSKAKDLSNISLNDILIKKFIKCIKNQEKNSQLAIEYNE